MKLDVALKRKCPICEGKNGKLLLEYYMPEYCISRAFPNHFDVVSCNRCGFIFYDILAKQSDYDSYYGEFSVVENFGIEYGKINENIKKLFNIRANEILKVVSKEKNFLEIGSANGYLLQALAEKGCKKLAGLDLSEKCLERLKREGKKAYYGSIFSKNNDLIEKFDCVAMTLVLEHIYDLDSAMKNILRLLKYNGYLYLEVPDSDNYKNLKTSPFSFFTYEHILHFNENSLRNLAGKYGLDIKTIVKRNAKFASSDESQPYISVIFHKVQNNKNLNFQKLNSNKIQEYIDKSEKNFELMFERLRKYNSSFALWGIGTAANFFIPYFKDKILIDYIVDSNELKQGRSINGIEIKMPKILKDENYKGIILIAAEMYKNEIIDNIRSLGMTNEIICLSDLI